MLFRSGRPRPAESGLVEAHAADAHGAGPINGEAQAGGVERARAQLHGLDPMALERTCVHVDFKRGPFAGQIRIAQIPGVQGVRVEPEHRPSPPPSVDPVHGQGNVSVAASGGGEQQIADAALVGGEVETSVEPGAAKLETEAVPGFQGQAQVVLGFRPFDRFRLRVEKEVLLPKAVAQRGLAMGQRFAAIFSQKR